MATLATVPLEKLPLASIDLETTGLNPAQDRICQIGLVARQQGDRDGIIDYWGRLRQQINDDDPLAPLLDAEIDTASQ